MSQKLVEVVSVVLPWSPIQCTLSTPVGTVVPYPHGSTQYLKRALPQNMFYSIPFLKRIKNPIMLFLTDILWCWWLMIAAYSCFLSKDFPFLLLNVTLLFFIWCLCIQRQTMFCWFCQLLLVFIHCREHFERESSEYMYSYICHFRFSSPRAFPGVNEWGMLLHPRCGLLSLFSSKISLGWTLSAPALMPYEGIKLIFGGAGLCPDGQFPKPDAN